MSELLTRISRFLQFKRLSWLERIILLSLACFGIWNLSSYLSFQDSHLPPHQDHKSKEIVTKTIPPKSFSNRSPNDL